MIFNECLLSLGFSVSPLPWLLLVTRSTQPSNRPHAAREGIDSYLLASAINEN